MATKTLSITEEAYDVLKSRKEPSESFSEIIIKLSGKKSLASFYGILGRKSAEALEKAVFEGRREHRKRHLKRTKNAA